MTTRREFLIAGGALGGGVLMSGGRAVHALWPSWCAQGAVVAFFDGQLWLDTSGASVAYRPATAARIVPTLTDEELLRTRGYI